MFLKKKILEYKIKHIFLSIISLCLFALITIIAAEYSGSKAKSTDDCLSCHEDKDLVMDSDDSKKSLFVNPELYKKSAHSIAECTDCHLNYKAEEIPHSADKKVENCRTCHEDSKGLEKSVHAKSQCIDCHSVHDTKKVSELKQDGDANCMSCHKKKEIAKFSSTIHGKKGVKCNDCHGEGHNVKNISRNQVTDMCGKCHNDSKMNFKGSIHHTVFKSGGKNTPVCTDCHGVHTTISSKHSIQSEACLNCHLDEKMFPGTETGSAKFVEQYKTSIHASIKKGDMESAGCTDCHGDHMIDSPDDPTSSTKRARLIETCGKCHADVVAKFKKSKHGVELMKNNEKAPTCSDCHGEHSIKSALLSDGASKLVMADKCLDCHKEGKIPHKNFKGEEELITGYKNSVHYQALVDGNETAPTCSDCHGAHEMELAENPDSKISKKNIATTCGQSECHGKQFTNFEGSIHEKGVTAGNPDAPTCNNCHGNHGIVSKDLENKLQKSRDLIQLCTNCHGSVEMIERNELPTKVSETYKESFHGLANRGGLKEAANCESCHGYHNVRPSSDSLSTIHKNNLPQTCGNCHPGATEILITSKIHLTDLKEDSPWVFWITRFYVILIFGLIGFMLLHNIQDYRKKKKSKTQADNEK